MTIAVSTHDLNLAAAVCRELVLLKDGRVLAQGPTADVLTPANVRALRRRGGRADARRKRTSRGGAHRPDAAMTIRTRLLTILPLFGLGTVVVVLAPRSEHVHQPPPRLRPRHPLGRQCRRADLRLARLPRVLAGALVGSTPRGSGRRAASVAEEPLATPFTLGVSAGAALGAMLAIAFQLEWGCSGVLGADGELLIARRHAIVYFLATRVHGGLSTNVILLAGVTLNSFFSAIIVPVHT